METNNIIVIVVIAIVIIAIAVALLSRRKSVPHDTSFTRVAPSQPESHGVVDSATTAVEDVVGPLVGLDLNPDLATAGTDDLTVLKGLGPKAAAQLNALGVTNYAQIAAWSPDNIAIVDERMGAFKGRIVRDKWVEQARYLAAGDRAGFEAQFGKLGS